MGCEWGENDSGGTEGAGQAGTAEPGADWRGGIECMHSSGHWRGGSADLPSVEEAAGA